jgi:hypothetical protein
MQTRRTIEESYRQNDRRQEGRLRKVVDKMIESMQTRRAIEGIITFSLLTLKKATVACKFYICQ